MKRDGFTLVEFVILIAALSAVALTAWVLFAPVNNWFFTQNRRSGFGESAVAVTRVLKEVRRIKDPNQIFTFTSDHLNFMDIDNNTVDFQLSGSNFLRDSDVLARNVNSLNFTYLDEDGAVAAVKQDIRVIVINLATASGDQTIRLESAARIRNL